jgi:hypothetical protein
MEKCKICSNECEPEKMLCTNCQNLVKDLDFDTFNTERKWLEELFVGRFNNFLVVFSLIVTAGFANSFSNWKYLVFYFGAILLSFCWLTLVRAYHKYDNAVKILLTLKEFKGKPNQIGIMQELYGKRKKNLFKSFIISRWLAFYIPIMCIVFLVIVGICINLCIIK